MEYINKKSSEKLYIFTSVDNAVTGLSKRVNVLQHTDQGHLDWAGYRMSHSMYGLRLQSHRAYDQVTTNVRSKILRIVLKSQKQRTTCLRGRG